MISGMQQECKRVEWWASQPLSGTERELKTEQAARQTRRGYGCNENRKESAVVWCVRGEPARRITPSRKEGGIKRVRGKREKSGQGRSIARHASEWRRHAELAN